MAAPACPINCSACDHCAGMYPGVTDTSEIPWPLRGVRPLWPRLPEAEFEQVLALCSKEALQRLVRACRFHLGIEPLIQFESEVRHAAHGVALARATEASKATSAHWDVSIADWKVAKHRKAYAALLAAEAQAGAAERRSFARLRQLWELRLPIWHGTKEGSHG
jgi:hypothetical protein